MWMFMYPMLTSQSNSLVQAARRIKAEQEKTNPKDPSKSTCKCGTPHKKKRPDYYENL